LIGQKAIVVGAGMAGLMAAAVLSKFFTNVIIVERDKLPPGPALRKGVPQGAHVHTFLGYAVEAMEKLIPPVDGDLWLATMYGRAGDTAPRDYQGFVDWKIS
jgi:phytoene dehydrogenase-like protein